jgi:hypothetical protein
MGLTRLKIAIGLVAWLVAGVTPILADDDTSWTQARADALAIAKWEREHPQPARPTALQGLPLEIMAPQIIAQAMKDLNGANLQTVNDAVEILKYMGDAAFDALVQGLASPNVRYRSAGILALRGKRAVPVLSKELATVSTATAPNSRGVPTQSDVRAIARALGNTRSPESIPALIQALPRGDPAVQAEIVNSLADYQDPRLFQPLADFIMIGKLKTTVDFAASKLLQLDPKRAREVFAQFKKRTDLPLIGGGEGMNVFDEVLADPNWSPGGWPFYPEDWPEIVQLTRDAQTLAGEHFGRREIQRLLDQAQRPAMPGGDPEVLNALASLHADETAALLLRNFDEEHMPLPVLMKFPTPEVVEYFLTRLQSDAPPAAVTRATGEGNPGARSGRLAVRRAQSRQTILQVLSQPGGNRWVMPVFVCLLDDPSLNGATPRGMNMMGMGRSVYINHAAIKAIYNWWDDGGNIRISSPSDVIRSFDPGQAIAGLKAWWAVNRVDFIAGKPVEPPPLPKPLAR